MWRFVAIGIVVLSGCLSPEERAYNLAARQRLLDQANEAVICETKDECEAAWGRAVAWVSERCGWKVKSQSDYMIETHGPMKSSPSLLACRVNRVPLDAKSARFDVTVACGYEYVPCTDDVLAAKASFVRAVGGLLKTMRAPDTLPADE